MPTNFEWTGGADETDLAGAINASDTAINVADGTGYPTGAGGKKFVIAIGDPDSGSYEKILCDSRSGNTITANASGRGYDGTSATSHAINDPVNHVVAAVALQNANDHVTDPDGTDHSDLVAAVAASQPALAPSTAFVVTNETSTSTTYADLATAGPAVTVTIGSSGRALVILSVDTYNLTAAVNAYASYATSGASTVAASDSFAVRTAGDEIAASYVIALSGLAAGSTTFTAKYRVDSGTGGWLRRRLTVIPL